VVYFHHAPYSSGEHGNDSRMQWPFAEWGATVVMAGHDHDYERLMIDGLPYFVNGVGGNRLYDFPSITTGSIFRYNADYGAMLVEASASSITYKFINRKGKLVDLFAQCSPESLRPIVRPCTASVWGGRNR
jgi:hypothetical protein